MIRALFVLLALLTVSCNSGSTAALPRSTSTTAATVPAQQAIEVAALFTSEGYEIPPPPEYPSGELSERAAADIDHLYSLLEAGRTDEPAIAAVAAHADARTAWLFTDILRFTAIGSQSEGAIAAFETVTGVTLPTDDRGGAWKASLDFLIAWDTPAVPGYDLLKQRLYTAVEPGWARFFADPESDIDWSSLPGAASTSTTDRLGS